MTHKIEPSVMFGRNIEGMNRDWQSNICNKFIWREIKYNSLASFLYLRLLLTKNCVIHASMTIFIFRQMFCSNKNHSMHKMRRLCCFNFCLDCILLLSIIDQVLCMPSHADHINLLIQHRIDEVTNEVNE